MNRTTLMIAAATLALAGGAHATQVSNAPTTPAQELPVDRGYDKDTPKHEAIDAQEAPTTQALNEEAGAVSAPSLPVEGPAADRYRADLARYEAAVSRIQTKQARDDARYARQQAAYANAMAAWRIQVQACEDGKHKICDQPAPDPAAFY